MKEHLNIISNTEELGKLHTTTPDMLDKYLKPTKVKKDWKIEEIFDRS